VVQFQRSKNNKTIYATKTIVNHTERKERKERRDRRERGEKMGSRKLK
jgi:hypothetical protein